MKALHAITITALLFGCNSDIRENQNLQKPNIVLVMVDDMGYSDLGFFGSQIETPNIDKLAENGTVFSQFYNTSRCCPSRAALMTGLYQHQAGVGDMTADHGYPSYRGFLSPDCPTIAEVLKAQGYQTIMSGKWHLGGEREQWPDKRGFDNFYGIPKGGGVYFYPFHRDRDVVLNGKKVTVDSSFYSTTAFTDHAYSFLESALKKDDPFFLYIPYIAPHFPIQAPESKYRKYRGKFRQDFQQLRQNRLSKMREKGILNKQTMLSLSDDFISNWDELNDDKKERLDLEMSIYAAQVEMVDDGIGKIVELLRKKGELDNTVILFLSDNGATHEGVGLNKKPLAVSEVIGSANSFRAYDVSWAHLSNTPFRMYKHWVHEGGISSPLIVHYPDMIKKHTVNNSVTHIMDIMPSILELTDSTYPKDQPLEGKSFVSMLGNENIVDRSPLFWEHRGNKAAREGDWKIVTTNSSTEWSLYNIKKDRIESIDLSDEYPEIKKSLIEKWHQWADRVGVIPPEVLRKK